jgi:hypothetical protein
MNIFTATDPTSSLTSASSVAVGGALAVAILMPFGFSNVNSGMYFSYIAHDGLTNAGWPGVQMYFRGSSGRLQATSASAAIRYAS